METTVNASLPAEANDKPLVQVRVITADANGPGGSQTPDEWVGVDGINITGTDINDAPVADNDSKTVAEDGADATFDLRSLVSDEETEDADIQYAIASVPPPSQGTTDINEDDVLVFDPAENFNSEEPVTITYRATDADGLSDTGTLTITVNAANDAPVVELSGDNDFNEGNVGTYTYTVEDPDGDNVTVEESCGDNATYIDTTEDNSFDCKFLDDPGTEVSVSADDGTAAPVTDTISVTVNNVPPTINDVTDDGPVNEGSPVTITVDATDPGSDTLTYDFDCSNNGDFDDEGDEADSEDNTGKCTFDDDDPHIVTVRVSDGDGGTATDTETVFVVNVAPTVELEGPVAANEGDTKSYTYTITDPGNDEQAVTTSCAGGDVSKDIYDPATGIGSFDCFFQDGSFDYDVKVKANDGFEDGSETITVAVDNVDPTADFEVDPTNIGEGDSVTLTFTNPNDPGTFDTQNGLLYEYACDGSFEEDADYRVENATRSSSYGCSYDDEGTFEVTARIIDQDNGSTEYTKTVTVEDVPPTVDLTGDNAADEGQTKTYSYTVSDPGFEDITAADIDTKCGTGGTKSNDAYDPDTGEGSFDCKFPDGPEQSSVSVTVNDGVAEPVSDSITVQVANVAPQFVLSGDTTADEGQKKTYTYTVSDPGTDDLGDVEESCGVNADDVNTPAEKSFDCTFTDGGDGKFSNVSVSATDSDGANGSGDLRVDVANVKPGVLLTGPITASEGETKTYEFDVSDPGTTDTHTAVASCGDDGELVEGSPTYSQQDNEGSFDCFFPNGDETTTVTVRVTDSDGAQDTDNRTVEVTVDNVAPVISEIEDKTIEENGTTVPIAFTVTDVDADTFEVTAASGNQDLVQNEDITLGGSGKDRTITVTPDANKSGTTKITITARDDSDERSTETFDVIVTPVNDAPVAGDANQTVAEDGDNATFDLGALVTDKETSDANIQYTIVTNPTPAQGTASITGQTLTFDPANDFNGQVQITYRATDKGDGAAEAKSDDGTLTITVTSANDAPVAEDDTAGSTLEDTPLVLQSSSLTANDSTGAQNENQTLTITEVSNFQKGTAVLSEDGKTVTFTPTANYNGPASFDYTVCDNGTPQLCSVETATVNVTVRSVNDNPNAVDDTKTGAVAGKPLTFPASDLTANDTDADGDNLTVTAVNNATNGIVSLDNGQVTFTGTNPGPASFDYTVSDGNGGTDTGTVSLMVEAAPPDNNVPNAADDSAATNEDTAVAINVLANDTDADDDDTLTIQSVSNPPNGTATIANGQVRYTPDANYSGTDTFTYTVSDGNGGTDTATVRVTVRPVNDAPIARNDSAQTRANQAVTVNVLANDTDVDGGTLRVASISQPNRGTVRRNDNGTLRFTPDRNFTGSVRFTYTVSDGRGGTDTASVTITVRR